ncbi:MAG: hypothetical protein LBF62_15020 [Tannerellaceae bacterium]|jgi:hypothetical protein|nr:hypothetical protein [Tannerellaceae bacterium]
MKNNDILLFLMIIAGCCLSIAGGSAQQAELKRERVFTGSGLYGFMNGGADQFLEYGVQKLTAKDVIFEGEEYNIEIYEMPSPEDAFGIYSLHTFRCLRADTLGCIDCFSPYQLQAVSGNNYVSVVFPSGSVVAGENAGKVLRMYASMDDNSQAPAIPAVLKTGRPYSGRLKYLKGPLSVSAAGSSLSRLMQDISYTGIWFEQERRSNSYRALIYPANQEDMEKIKKKIPPSGILEHTADYIYISGHEKEETEDNPGIFGF